MTDGHEPIPGGQSWRQSLSRMLRSPLGYIVLLGFGLRLHGIGEHNLWHDELHTLGNTVGLDLYLFEGADIQETESARPASHYQALMAEDRFLATLARNVTHEGHPPLYLIAMRAWTSVVGNSPAWLRGFSAIASILTMIPLALLARRLGGRRAEVATSVLFAVSPFQIYYAQEARSYALLLLLTSTSLLGAGMIATGHRADKFKFLWILGATLAMLTHYYAAIFCSLLALLILCYARGRSPRWRLIVAGLPFALVLPWLAFLPAQMSAHKDHWTASAVGITEGLRGASSTLLELLTGVHRSAPPSECAIAIVALAVAIVVGSRSRSKVTRGAVAIVVLGILAHAGLVFTLDLVTDHHTILVPRYSAPVSLALVLLLGLAFPNTSTLSSIPFWGFGFVTIWASVLTVEGARAPRQMFREAGSYINERWTPGDTVVVTPSGPALMGMALALDPQILIMAVPEEGRRSLMQTDPRHDERYWFVRERLGLAYGEAYDTPGSTDTPSTPIRFVGLDVVLH